jgi:CDP-diacylglycerol--glycerol-3-phosphate 3-phosphatidyltransferase
MNLPNALSATRIVATPAISILPMFNSSGLRLTAFVLFVLAAVTDYVDGHLARSRKEETDLGKMLDPLADKALLLGTLVPMFLLAKSFPFITPLGPVGLPLWVVLVVVGREIFMTLFRQAAAKRGVVIAAIRSAKWKTGFQLVWQGAAYCWFWAATVAAEKHIDNHDAWRDFALFNGTIGTLMMIAAVYFTIFSLVVYMRSFSGVFTK